MSRLRWPDSTNSVSEKPGTIQSGSSGQRVEKVTTRVAYVMAGRGLAVPPRHHRRRTAERLTLNLSRRTSRARSPCRGSGPGR